MDRTGQKFSLMRWLLLALKGRKLRVSAEVEEKDDDDLDEVAADEDEEYGAFVEELYSPSN